MAFFKFRKRGDDQAATAAPPESIEAMRKRAKHRLIGAVVLVLIGVIGFPLLFDRQPRPIAVDIPIDIPDRNKIKPLSIPLPPPAPTAAGPVTTPTPALPVAPVVVAVAAPAVPASAPVEPKETVAAAKVEDKTTKPADSVKAQAVPEEKSVEKVPTAPDERFVVQVGAFADVTKARAARLKLEQGGLKTYTQVVETREGRRIRVRVGPFASKAEVDKAAEKIKKLDLPAAILTL